MPSKIVGFENGWGNCALRVPYCVARLDCGHVIGVDTVSPIARCVRCGFERQLERPGVTTICPQCDCRSFSWGADQFKTPHNPEHRIQKLGDEVECKGCAEHLRDIEWLKALDISTVHHSRLRHGSYYYYRLDKTSPSNFMLIGATNCNPEIDELLRQKRLSPLSPTEPA